MAVRGTSIIKVYVFLVWLTHIMSHLPHFIIFLRCILQRFNINLHCELVLVKLQVGGLTSATPKIDLYIGTTADVILRSGVDIS